MLTLLDPPHGLFHAVMAPTEDGRWIIVIADHSGGSWIDTWDAFLEASRLLITPTLSDALRYALPPDGIRHYRFPVSTWKHFEHLPRLPRGVLPVTIVSPEGAWVTRRTWSSSEMAKSELG